MPPPEPPVCIRYEFAFDSGRVQTFEVLLQPGTLLRVVEPTVAATPEWTRLGQEQCQACPLDSAQVASCPAAIAVAPTVDAFRGSRSTEEVDVTVTTEARTYSKRIPLARGVSSLLGLLMATSGCPVLDPMRPMVLTHLPFATPEETTYRSFSTYLLQQYFAAERGEEPDWQMAGLAHVIDRLREVNRSFCERLGSVCTADANMNAVVILDCFAAMTGFRLDEREQRLEQLRQLFRPGSVPAPADR